MDRISVIIAVFFILALGIVFFMGILDNTNEQCTNKNGVVVKTTDGWMCLDVKVIK